MSPTEEHCEDTGVFIPAPATLCQRACSGAGCEGEKSWGLWQNLSEEQRGLEVLGGPAGAVVEQRGGTQSTGPPRPAAGGERVSTTQNIVQEKQSASTWP